VPSAWHVSACTHTAHKHAHIYTHAFHMYQHSPTIIGCSQEDLEEGPLLAAREGTKCMTLSNMATMPLCSDPNPTASTPPVHVYYVLIIVNVRLKCVFVYE
jgi:hypothetical protein